MDQRKMIIISKSVFYFIILSGLLILFSLIGAISNSSQKAIGFAPRSSTALSASSSSLPQRTNVSTRSDTMTPNTTQQLQLLPTSNNLTLYDNFTYGIKIKYPIDWTINTPPAVANDSNGSNNNFITIVEFNPPYQNNSQYYSPYVMVSIQFIDKNPNLDNYIDHVISVARSSLENFNLIEASTKCYTFGS